MNEVKDIHPLVALWLTKNGYSYIHEYKLPDYGRVDFYATHSDGHTMLVEAKSENLYKVITQLKGYSVQMPESRLSISAPINFISDRIRDVCLKYGINIIELEYFEPSQRDDLANTDEWNQHLIRKILNTQKQMHSPESIIEIVKHWHEAKFSIPFLDFLVLYVSSGQVSPDLYQDEVVFSTQEKYLDAMLDSLFDMASDFSIEEKRGAYKLVELLLGKTEGTVSIPRITGSSLWKELENI